MGKMEDSGEPNAQTVHPMTGARGFDNRQPNQQQRESNHKARNRPRHSDVEQRPAGTDRRLDANKGAHGADQSWSRNEKRKRRVDAVLLAEEEVPKLVRQQNCHQRDREGNPHQKPAGLLPDPQRVKQGHVAIAQGERRKPTLEIVIELGADNQRGEHGQQQ